MGRFWRGYASWKRRETSRIRGSLSDTAGKVVRGEKKVVTDGPYAESKDLVLGFMIVEARDLAHASELSMGCPMLGGSGSVEIRPVAGVPS
jgi:hypothetical protein